MDGKDVKDLILPTGNRDKAVKEPIFYDKLGTSNVNAKIIR